ncbi:MAG TPA: glutaredoxin 3 [Gammaproteobacteria bacterium]|nr:glutaredoxin 3 [Gammaproteobacteria bacterium]
MATIIIYSSLTCPYCEHAKDLLEAKGLSYQEINVEENPAYYREMLEKTKGERTVPQIFIDGKHIGGFSDLKRLSDSGKLEALLKK